MDPFNIFLSRVSVLNYAVGTMPLLRPAQYVELTFRAPAKVTLVRKANVPLIPLSGYSSSMVWAYSTRLSLYRGEIHFFW